MVMLEDYEIVALYWERDQAAIAESDAKYGRHLRETSRHILCSYEDAEECAQDTFLAAWHSMPQDRPTYLGAYLMKIIRNISIDRYRKQRAQKRYAGEQLALDELSECIPDLTSSVFDTMERGALAAEINGFLAGLDPEKRMVFVRRYFFSESIREISEKMGISESKVKSMLMRMREKLAARLGRDLSGGGHSYGQGNKACVFDR